MPKIQDSPGYIRLKPITTYVRRPIATVIMFFVRIFTLFFARHKPVSTSANPGCIEKTRIAPKRIQRLFTVNISADTFAGAAAAASSARAARHASMEKTVVAVKIFLFMIV